MQVNFQGAMTTKNFFVPLIACILLTGCSSPETLGNSLISVGSGNEAVEESKAEREEAIRAAILSIDGVKAASVAISGKTALIGLRLSTEDTDETLRLKELAAKRAEETDQWIKSIAITANSEIFSMIEDM